LPCGRQAAHDEIVTIQLDKIEGVQERLAIVAPIADAVEACDAIIVTDDRLAVDDRTTGFVG
jgi:hypothetical protein